MAISLYSGFVPVCLQLLGGLKTVLRKAEEHATAQKWDTATVLNLRLYPDMFTLERQVRQVCNHALAAGRVAGSAVPGTSSASQCQCGFLVVPEDRSRPTGHTIRLLVAIIPTGLKRGAALELYFYRYSFQSITVPAKVKVEAPIPVRWPSRRFHIRPVHGQS